MSLIQRHRLVERVLDEKVRPNLLKDGGNLEVVDMGETDGATEVHISYQGACRGCASATTGTLALIEQALQKELDPSIRVVPE
jgi:NifU-like protein